MGKAEKRRQDMVQTLTPGLVSIVTPVYNGESHLCWMLESVLDQTYPYIEMILVDDGSTDGTVALAESYREQFRQRGFGYRVVTGPHKSASGAINRGLPFVTGQYLIWPDSDDVLEPDSVELRVEFLQAYPQYRAVRSLPYYFDGDTGQQVDYWDENMGDISKERLFWDVLEFKTYVCCGCYMLESASLFEIYPQRQIPEYAVGQNFQMLLPFLYQHACPTICERLYGVCVRPGSHSRTELSRAQEEKKFQDYESLVDEIARICGMGKAEKKRVELWKLRRRYQLAVKYGQKKAAVLLSLRLEMSGSHGGIQMAKTMAWAMLGGTKLGGWLDRRYRQVKKWMEGRDKRGQSK